MLFIASKSNYHTPNFSTSLTVALQWCILDVFIVGSRQDPLSLPRVPWLSSYWLCYMFTPEWTLTLNSFISERFPFLPCMLICDYQCVEWFPGDLIPFLCRQLLSHPCMSTVPVYLMSYPFFLYNFFFVEKKRERNTKEKAIIAASRFP